MTIVTYTSFIIHVVDERSLDTNRQVKAKSYKLHPFPQPGFFMYFSPDMIKTETDTSGVDPKHNHMGDVFSMKARVFKCPFFK